MSDTAVFSGARLTEIREGAGWSVYKLADAMGVNDDTVRNWESGWTTPNASRLFQLADVFGVALTAFGGTETA